ncbi:MAG: hypothetical protein NVV62_06450 [Terricaulis sp.]|nr:hypothetical protein [Terricaulis sp.]
MSEPATEALLLTQIVPDSESDQANELVTAHAKPVARQENGACACRAGLA